MKSYIPGQSTPQEMSALLLGAIAPRPIAFASTVDREGHPNLAPFSFFNIFGVNPPVVVFSPSRSGRTNTTKDTYENIKEVPEVVINLVTWTIVQQANLASAIYPRGVNEFVKAQLTPLPSDLVKPFRVKESPVQLECKVLRVFETGQGPSAGNLVICEVLKIHVDEKILNEQGRIDPQKADWVARMGGELYCRASGDALFRVPRPGDGPSIGIDQLPPEIRKSRILTGNDLGRMGLVKQLPSHDEVIRYQEDATLLGIFSAAPDPQARRDQVHCYAQKLLDAGETLKAIAICIEK
jgi:flavin reductase (DIM6/NTAB) family NADH-FMN oxidoreductase RutF